MSEMSEEDRESKLEELQEIFEQRKAKIDAGGLAQWGYNEPEVLDDLEEDANRVRGAVGLPAIVLPLCGTCQRKQAGDHFHCSGCKFPLCVNCWVAHTQGSGFDRCPITDPHCRKCCEKVLDQVMQNAFEKVFGDNFGGCFDH